MAHNHVADEQQRTVAAIRAHHDELARTLGRHASAVLSAVDSLSTGTDRARTELVNFCERELLPHATAEEGTLYRAAAELPAVTLLVSAMLAEHRVLRDLVTRCARARTPGETAAAVGALRTLFRAHLDKENDLLLPALVESGVEVGPLLSGMHEILGGHADRDGSTDQGGGQGPGGCGCGCDCGDPTTDRATGPAGAVDGAGDGELDVRELPPAVRHTEIFAAFHGLGTGTSFVLVNDHDPKPLRYQFEAEYAGEFRWEYVEAGPQVWRVRIGRV